MTKVVFLTTITSELNYPKFSQNLIYPSEFLCDLLYEICPIDGYIKTRFKIIFGILTVVLFIAACNEDEANVSETFELSISGLEDLGTTAQYEGWIIVNGNAKTTGTFTVDANGFLSKTKFNVDEDGFEIVVANN